MPVDPLLRATLIVDYQNVHLTAFDVFDPRGDRHDSLIHPMRFAQRAIVERNERQREGFALARIERVIAFRGLHHVDHHWEQHRRAQDQAARWREDGVDVQLRDLKYSYQLGADGRPVIDIHGKKIPLGRPKEKGIDVLCALACAPSTRFTISAKWNRSGTRGSRPCRGSTLGGGRKDPSAAEA